MQSSKIIIESNSIGQLLVWPMQAEERLVQYQMYLLTRRRPGCLLACHLRFQSGQPQICLETTDLVPLDESFSENELVPGHGKEILREIVDDLVIAADMLLPLDQFSLQPSMIYLQADQHLRLAFWPLRHQKSNSGEFEQLLTAIGSAFKISLSEVNQWQQNYRHGGLRSLQKNLVTSTDDMKPAIEPSLGEIKVKPDRLCLRQSLIRASTHIPAKPLIILHLVGAAAIIGAFWSGPSWSASPRIVILLYLTVLLLIDACRLRNMADQNRGSQPIAKNVSESKSLLDQLKFLASGYFAQFNSWFSIQCKVPGPAADDQTVLLAANSADFRMALLSEGMPGTPEENEGIRAFILIDEFIVGRDQKICDLCLTEPGIGRQHAKILRRAGSFFIYDMGSRNGTSLDGRRLPKNVENVLPDQCVIQFASRKFYFQAD